MDQTNYINASSSTNNLIKNITLTPNQIAACEPIARNYTLAQQEAKCTAAEPNAPWYPTLLSYEHHDSTRSKLYDYKPSSDVVN